MCAAIVNGMLIPPTANQAAKQSGHLGSRTRPMPESAHDAAPFAFVVALCRHGHTGCKATLGSATTA
jgi:hypothetical protein